MLRMVLVCVYCGHQDAVEVADRDLAQVLGADVSTVCGGCHTRLVCELIPAQWYVIHDNGDRHLSKGTS
jgi:hypothetical protein